jgi:hypothetical protein
MARKRTITDTLPSASTPAHDYFRDRVQAASQLCRLIRAAEHFANPAKPDFASLQSILLGTRIPTAQSKPDLCFLLGCGEKLKEALAILNIFAALLLFYKRELVPGRSEANALDDISRKECRETFSPKL